MIFTLLLLSSAAIGLYLSVRSQNPIPVLLTLILIAGLLLAVFPVKEFEIRGIYFYMASLIPVFIYGFSLKRKGIIPRLIILLIPASMFTYWLWQEQHWHGNTILLPVLTLFLTVIGLFFKRDLKREWGMLIIISMDALTIIIENLLKHI